MRRPNRPGGLPVHPLALGLTLGALAALLLSPSSASGTMRALLARAPGAHGAGAAASGTRLSPAPQTSGAPSRTESPERDAACAAIDRDPAGARAAFSALGRSLVAIDTPEETRAVDLLRACSRTRSLRLATQGSWTPAEAETLAAILLVDPERFADDEPFRRRVLLLLPDALDPKAPAALRDDLLAELNQIRGFDFAASDALEAAWGRAPRRASERKIELGLQSSGRAPALRFDADTSGRLAASIYSLSSTFFAPDEAKTFLRAVAALDPARELLVLADPPMLRALADRARRPRLHLLPTFGRAYTPWPRDPFTLVRDGAGRLIALARPNLQPGREEDANLAAELVQNLPAQLDRSWGGREMVAWAVASTPFHNGQVLLTQDAAWITLHALEPRVLALLGLERVPVESFGSAEGIDRYLSAVDRAAAELAALYGRPVRFIHPLPRTGPLAARTEILRVLGGAAGYDLDSLLSLVPLKGGGLAALVADFGLGRTLLAEATPADLATLRAGYGLTPEGEALRAALLSAQEAPAPTALAGFLDLAARQLATEGFAVRRLPLLSIPVPLLRDRAGLTHPEFLLTWNNVVVETRGKAARAEGFSYLFPPGDRAARETFEPLGVHLDLLPPLVRSIVLNGGYRCASNHLRVAAGRRSRPGGVETSGASRLQSIEARAIDDFKALALSGADESIVEADELDGGRAPFRGNDSSGKLQGIRRPQWMNTDEPAGGLQNGIDRLNAVPMSAQCVQAPEGRCTFSRVKKPLPLAPSKCRSTLDRCPPPGDHSRVGEEEC